MMYDVWCVIETEQNPSEDSLNSVVPDAKQPFVMPFRAFVWNSKRKSISGNLLSFFSKFGMKN